MENRLSDILKEGAVSLGLCKPWTEAWGDCDQQGLIEKYKKGIRFCAQRNFPSPEFIEENFDKELLQLNGVYCNDKEVIQEDLNSTYILRGDSSITFTARPFTVKDINVCENTVLHISAKACSKVFIRIYDKCKVILDASTASKVYIYVYSSEAIVSYDGRGQVIIRKGPKEDKE